MKNEGKRMILVYNPQAGRGQIKFSLAYIIEIFSEALFDIVVYPTKKSGDGQKIVKERAKEFDIIICCGGDGTLNEVINGVMKCGCKNVIGYIPAGNIYDLANSLGIPKQMNQAAKLIVENVRHNCDIGKFNNDYFIHMASFGLFAEISYQIDQEMKNNFGYMAYFLEALKNMCNLKSNNLKIVSEEYSDEGEFVLGMVTNTNTIGGFKGIIGSENKMDDGLFEVMFLRNPVSIVEWASVVASIINKENNKAIVRFKTKCIKIKSDTPIVWMLDGENGGIHTEVEIINLHNAYQIISG